MGQLQLSFEWGGIHDFSVEVRAMRGPDAMQESLFAVAKLDDFVPADHPLRSIRLLAQQVVEGLFAEVMRLAEARGLPSKEHFSVDGTLIQAWASQKRFRPKDSSDDQRPGGGGRNAQADWWLLRRADKANV